jgi:hypothetical protein
VRVGLHHQTLLFWANFVRAELAPCDEKLLFGSEPVDVRRARFALEGSLVGEESNLGAA